MLELFGPSSGGKSSLAARLLGEGVRGEVQARLLARCGLGWLRGRLVRLAAIDALAALGVLATWGTAGRYYTFAARHALRMPRAGWRLRLNLLRNAWKAVSLRLLAPRLLAPGERLVMDEGPLQVANYLFVNASTAPDLAALEEFLRLVPLPDTALYVRGAESDLVARTLTRTHPRVPAGSREATERFVAHALAVFDRIAAEPSVRQRLQASECAA